METSAHALMSAFDIFAILLLFAVIFAVVNERYIELPRPVALLLGSMALCGTIIAIDTMLGDGDLRQRLRMRVLNSHWPDLMLNVLLALMLFAGTLHVDMRALRSKAWTIGALATGSVVIATAIFGVGFWFLLRLAGMPVPLSWCLVIGAILSPTDAVAVEGLLSKVALPPRLRALISGESLFNDGAAVVLFTAALAITSGNTELVGHGRLTKAILLEAGGGGALGAVAGYLTFRAVRLTVDHTLALMISIALVLCTYRAALALHISGPIAVVAAGLVFNYMLLERAGEVGAILRNNLSTLWSLVDDLLNMLLYMLIGLVALAVDLTSEAAIAIAIAIPLAFVARLASVAVPILALDLRLPHTGKTVGVLTWAGLRGGVSIALALILPESPQHDLLLTVCFTVVIFTVIVQGLSLPRLVTALYGPPETPPTPPH